MQNEEKMRSYGLIVSEERYVDTQSVIVRFLAREGDAKSPINPNSNGEDTLWNAPKWAHGLFLSDLSIRCYWSQFGKDEPWLMGPYVTYAHVHGIDARMATRMATTLNKIERKIVRTKATEPGAVANAIRATWGVVIREGGGTGWHDTTDYRWTDLVEQRDIFRAAIAKIKPKREENVA